MKDLKLTDVKIDDLRPYQRNARVHDGEQIEKLMKSISEFGYIAPVVIDENNMILVGHGRVEAARRLGMTTVPCVCVADLAEDQKRAYILADNLLTERGGWDLNKLEEEVTNIEMDMTEFGFPEFDEDEEQYEEDEQDDGAIICPKCGYKFYEGDMYE